jgi:hypothetical protein
MHESPLFCWPTPRVESAGIRSFDIRHGRKDAYLLRGMIAMAIPRQHPGPSNRRMVCAQTVKLENADRFEKLNRIEAYRVRVDAIKGYRSPVTSTLAVVSTEFQSPLQCYERHGPFLC